MSCYTTGAHGASLKARHPRSRLLGGLVARTEFRALWQSQSGEKAMDHKDPADRREFPRLDRRLAVRMTSVDLAEGATVTNRVESRNMSFGGVCMVTDRLPEQGAVVALAVDLPDREVADDLFAEVVWTRARQDGRYEVGLRFLSASEGALEELARVLQPDGGEVGP